MRDGMSVKEIYAALDRLERLDKAYIEEREKRQRLETIIQKSIDTNLETIKTYHRVVESADDWADRFEFLGKASGLLEATMTIREYMKEE